MQVSTDPNIAEAARWADFLRSRGFNVLPSDPNPTDGRKKPLCRYAHYRETAAPADLFDRFPTSNLQVMTGRFWRLLVIDLDGPESIEWWNGLDQSIPRTWAVRSGGGGLHVWFRLRAGMTRELPKAILWKGDGKHSAAERLCDKSLAMAPPSIHPVTGKRYTWANDGPYVPPTRLAMPGDCPRWLLDLPPIRSEVVPYVSPVRPDSPRIVTASGRYRASDVRESIPDVLALVASWGVKFGTDTGRDWVECHALGREDRNPSAAINRRTGSYDDKGTGTSMGLFDLAVALGQYADWRDAVADLGERYRAAQQGVA